jgi:ubiE/COQ5 methyltransferase family
LSFGFTARWRRQAVGGLPLASATNVVDLMSGMGEPRSANVLAWEAEGSAADVVVSSLGLKTYDRDQQGRLAQIAARLLKPGGCYSFIEIYVPLFPPLRSLYMFYLKRLIPPLAASCWAILSANTSHFDISSAAQPACAG